MKSGVRFAKIQPLEGAAHYVYHYQLKGQIKMFLFQIKKVTTQRDADRRIGERLGDEVQINFVLQNYIILFVRPTGEERYSQSWRQT